MEQNKIYSYEELKNFLEKIQFSKVELSEFQIYTLISNCEKQYFTENKTENFEESKVIFKLLYSYLEFTAGILKYRNQYNSASQIYKGFENIASFALSKKIMKYISWINYLYNLSFLLYQTNQEFHAINRCNSITSDFFKSNSNKEIYDRILIEESPHPKTNSDYSEYLNYLYRISILGQLICAKVGAKDIISLYYYRQKYFLEKILYLGNEPTYKNEFATDELDIYFGGFMIYAIIDKKDNSKGIKKFKIIVKRKIKAMFYTTLRITSGYGEKPSRFLFVSIAIIFLFAAIYSFLETNSFYNIQNYLFQSIFIFSSFGLSDNSITLSCLNKTLISIEIAFGIISVNGFIVMLVRKYLR